MKQSKPDTFKRCKWALRRLELCFWMAAFVLVTPLLLSHAARAVESHRATHIMDTTPAPAPTAEATTDEMHRPDLALVTDQSLWSSQRLAALNRFRETLTSPAAIGVLELPAHGARIPIYSGASELNMTLGAGHLRDTAPLQGDGTIALTAHRDGAFRVLKDLQPGDTIRLHHDGLERRFTVKSFEIVTPDRVDVLEDRGRTQLTLVTCYPFYHLGSAPKRYIVHAELQPAARDDGAAMLTPRTEPGTPGGGAILQHSTNRS